MTTDRTTRIAAMVLGAAGGIIELYLVITKSTLGFGSVWAVFTIVMPVIIVVASAWILTARQVYIPTGIIIGATGILHVLVQTTGVHVLPIILIGLASAIGIFLDAQWRTSEAQAALHSEQPRK